MALSLLVVRVCPEKMKRTSGQGAFVRALALLAAAVFVASAAAAGTASTAPTLELVHVGLQTSMSYPYQYALAAYNTSGYQVASYQSSFPGAAFELPVGTYLLTASAYFQNNTYCLDCPLAASASSSGGGTTASAVKPFGNEVSEYGYSVAQVSGPTSITVSLRNASAIPLSRLTVYVGYANGTAAADASVSAYVVGSYYAYAPGTTSYGQTGETGDVTLTMPQAPVDVSAYLSLPLKLPTNTSTVTVNVGGQKTNVTVYLQPSYVSLSGEALILPPQTSASVVLRYQPVSYPIVYGGTPTAAGTEGTTPSVSTGTAEQTSTSSQTRIAPFTPTGSQLTTTSPGTSSSQGLPFAGGAASAIEVTAVGGALVVGVVVGALLTRKSRGRASPA